MLLPAKDTDPGSAEPPGAIKKRPRRNAASRNFSDTRGVAKNYLGGAVDAGGAGLGAAGFGPAGLAAAPAAGAGTPDCVL